MNATAGLAGKVVIVTGASRGLGRAMAEGLAQQGARLALVARPGSEANMQATIEGLRHINPACQNFPLYGDIAAEADCASFVERVVRHFGQVDALVNNAALGMDAAGAITDGARRFDKIDPAIWRKMVDVNINGTWLMTRAVLPVLLQRGWGRIVNVATSHVTMVKPGFAPYGPSKAAVEAMTVLWAKELAGTGVTANLLLPGGAADTDMMPVRDWPQRSELIAPAVMAAPVCWLCSPASDDVTGMRLTAKDWPPGAVSPGPALSPSFDWNGV